MVKDCGCWLEALCLCESVRTCFKELVCVCTCVRAGLSFKVLLCITLKNINDIE